MDAIKDRAVVMFSVDRYMTLFDLVGKCNAGLMEGFFVVDGVRTECQFGPEQLLIESFEQKANGMGTKQTRIYCRYNEHGWNRIFDRELKVWRRVVRKDTGALMYDAVAFPT